jgi:hypothetical protein
VKKLIITIGLFVFIMRIGVSIAYSDDQDPDQSLLIPETPPHGIQPRLQSMPPAILGIISSQGVSIRDIGALRRTCRRINAGVMSSIGYWAKHLPVESLIQLNQINYSKLHDTDREFLRRRLFRILLALTGFHIKHLHQDDLDFYRQLAREGSALVYANLFFDARIQSLEGFKKNRSVLKKQYSQAQSSLSLLKSKLRKTNSFNSGMTADELDSIGKERLNQISAEWKTLEEEHALLSTCLSLGTRRVSLNYRGVVNRTEILTHVRNGLLANSNQQTNQSTPSLNRTLIPGLFEIQEQAANHTTSMNQLVAAAMEVHSRNPRAFSDLLSIGDLKATTLLAHQFKIFYVLAAYYLNYGAEGTDKKLDIDEIEEVVGRGQLYALKIVNRSGWLPAQERDFQTTIGLLTLLWVLNDGSEKAIQDAQIIPESIKGKLCLFNLSRQQCGVIFGISKTILPESNEMEKLVQWYIDQKGDLLDLPVYALIWRLMKGDEIRIHQLKSIAEEILTPFVWPDPLNLVNSSTITAAKMLMQAIDFARWKDLD